MFPTLVDLHFIQIPTYGVLLAIGIALALFLLKRRADAAGLPGDRIADLGIWMVLWGLAGAKLLLVITEPRYLSSWAALLDLFRAGGVFYGGFVGAVIAAIVLLRRYRLPFLATADVAVPSLALGHFFGRLGCFAAGCCYGAQCSEPWGVEFTNPRAAEVSGTPLGVHLHPTQLYEAAFNLLNYVFLAWLYSRRPRPGTVLGAYLIAYGSARFVIELFRGDPDRGFLLGGLLSTSQAIAAFMVPIGIAVVIRSTARRR